MRITKTATLLLAYTTAHAVRVKEHDTLTPPSEQLLAEIEDFGVNASFDEVLTGVNIYISTQILNDDFKKDFPDEIVTMCDEYLDELNNLFQKPKSEEYTKITKQKYQKC